MIVKGEIQTIDYNGNTCTVRMPIFESTGGGDKAVASAIISNTPGSYNGYKEGDIVLVAFENNQLQSPVVIGKLYLGAAEENKDPRGSINCTTITSSKANTLPLDAEIKPSYGNTVATANGTTAFKTVKELVNAVCNNTQKLSEINQNNINYLSSEQIIGTWIDNKTIYRKVFEYIHIPEISSGSDFDLSINLSNLNYDTIWVNLNMSLQIGSNFITNQYTMSTDYWNTYINLAQKEICIRGKARDNIKKHIIVVEYTKAS